MRLSTARFLILLCVIFSFNASALEQSGVDSRETTLVLQTDPPGLYTFDADLLTSADGPILQLASQRECGTSFDRDLVFTVLSQKGAIGISSLINSCPEIRSPTDDLIPMLRDSDDPCLRFYAMIGLLLSFREGDLSTSQIDETVRDLRGILNNPKSEMHREAMRTLYYMGSVARENVPDLLRFLNDPDPLTAASARDSIIKICQDSVEVTPLLVKGLDDQIPENDVYILDLIGQLCVSDEDAGRAVSQFLSTEIPEYKSLSDSLADEIEKVRPGLRATALGILRNAALCNGLLPDGSFAISDKLTTVSSIIPDLGKISINQGNLPELQRRVREIEIAKQRVLVALLCLKRLGPAAGIDPETVVLTIGLDGRQQIAIDILRALRPAGGESVRRKLESAETPSEEFAFASVLVSLYRSDAATSDSAALALPILSVAVSADQPPVVRLRAARLLGDLGKIALPAVPLLEELEKDDHLALRSAARAAIEKIRR